MFSWLNIGLGAGVGALLASSALGAYNQLVENPRIRAETRQLVEAEARARTEAAINEVGNASEKSRAMRRFCRDSGLQYNFATGKCIEQANR